MEPCILGPEDGLEVMVWLAGKWGWLCTVSSLAVRPAYQRCGKEKHTERVGVGVESRAKESLCSLLLMALLFHKALRLSRALSFDTLSLPFSIPNIYLTLDLAWQPCRGE